jgi:hypothetical protein
MLESGDLDRDLRRLREALVGDATGPTSLALSGDPRTAARGSLPGMRGWGPSPGLRLRNRP